MDIIGKLIIKQIIRRTFYAVCCLIAGFGAVYACIIGYVLTLHYVKITLKALGV